SAYAPHAAALAARDAPALLAVTDEMAAIGADAYAMEAAVSAARQFVAEGREDSARRAVTRAREFFAPDQGAEFPTIDGLGVVATELTRREAQIASLAARGLSNAEIPDRTSRSAISGLESPTSSSCRCALWRPTSTARCRSAGSRTATSCRS